MFNEVPRHEDVPSA